MTTRHIDDQATERIMAAILQMTLFDLKNGLRTARRKDAYHGPWDRSLGTVRDAYARVLEAVEMLHNPDWHFARDPIMQRLGLTGAVLAELQRDAQAGYDRVLASYQLPSRRKEAYGVW